MGGIAGRGLFGCLGIITLAALLWGGILAAIELQAEADIAEAETEIAQIEGQVREARIDAQMQAESNNNKLALLQQGQDHFRQDIILLTTIMIEDGRLSDREIADLLTLIEERRGSRSTLERLLFMLAGAVAGILLFSALLVVVVFFRGRWKDYQREWAHLQDGGRYD